MELVIIALIAVEVVIVSHHSYSSILELKSWRSQALIRDGPELWHMFFGEDIEEKPHKTT